MDRSLALNRNVVTRTNSSSKETLRGNQGTDFLHFFREQVKENKLIIVFEWRVLAIHLILGQRGEASGGKPIYWQLMKVERMLADCISFLVTN